MRALHFGGLPEDYQVGPARLLPCSDLGSVLQPCDFCDKVNVKFQICDAGHSLCPDCVAPSQIRRRWCVLCRKMVVFSPISLPSTLIDTLKFSCACTFRGTLREIKEHLICTDNPETCFTQDTIREPRCCGNLRRTVASLSASVRDTQQSLRKLDCIRYLLTNKLAEVQALTNVFAGCRRFFCFRFDMIISKDSVTQHKIVDGVPLEVRVIAERVDEELHLRISVAGSKEPKIRVWPLKKSIVVHMLNWQGYVMNEWTIRTFERGQYAHLSFEDPTLDAPTHGYQIAVVNNIAALLEYGESDHLMLSLEVRDSDHRSPPAEP